MVGGSSALDSVDWVILLGEAGASGPDDGETASLVHSPADESLVSLPAVPGPADDRGPFEPPCTAPSDDGSTGVSDAAGWTSVADDEDMAAADVLDVLAGWLEDEADADDGGALEGEDDAAMCDDGAVLAAPEEGGVEDGGDEEDC